MSSILREGEAPQRMDLVGAESARREPDDTKVYCCNSGLYFASIQFLNEKGEWWGWGKVATLNCTDFDWWPGIKLRAASEGFFVSVPIVKDLPLNPGDTVELTPEGNRLIAMSNGMRIGVVEPRVAARLLKLIADGNKYLAGVTSLGAQDVRIIIREVFQDPRNYGKVSFPTAAKSTDLRPYTKGTLLREDEELEEDLEDDVEDEEITDLESVIPPDDTTEEAFEEESDELEDGN